MRYKLQNIRINRGVNSRGTYEWLQAELFIEEQPWANPARLPQMPSMTQQYIDLFKEENDANLKEIPEYRVEKDGKPILQVFEVTAFPKVETVAKTLQKQNSSLSDEDAAKMAKNMLDNAITHVSHVHTMVQPLVGLWQPVYRRPTKINGVEYPRGAARIGTNGKPVPAVRSLRIVMRQYFDIDDNDWKDAENPEDIANTMLERGYERVEEQAAQPISANASSKAVDIPDNGEALTEEQKAEMQKRIAEIQAMMNK